MNELQRSDVPTLIRRQRVQELTGLSRATIWRLIKGGRFPRPVNLDDNYSAPGVASRWVLSEIIGWINARVAARDEQLAARKIEAAKSEANRATTH